MAEGGNKDVPATQQEQQEGEAARKRTLKFSEAELETLITEMVPNHDILFGRSSHKVPETRKRRIWEGIQAKVNALGVTHRTVEVLRKRCTDSHTRVPNTRGMIGESYIRHTEGHRGFTMEDIAADEERELRYYGWRRYLPWCKVFTLSLLAGVLTTAIGVLIVSLVFKEYLRPYRDSGSSESSNSTTTGTSPLTGSTPDITFKFHCSLNHTKEKAFQGGSIQCASYRKNSSTYSSAEEMAFGQTLHYFQSEISVCTLTIKSGGLRIPHWNLNANAHGLVIEGIVWVGVVEVGSTTAVTYNASMADVLFFPRNRPYWIKNIGNISSTIVLFFSTSEEPFSLEVNDVFFTTPEDILARTLLVCNL
ncbi:uncharacterized protein LOC144820106 [Lissotriton helveticus]